MSEDMHEEAIETADPHSTDESTDAAGSGPEAEPEAAFFDVTTQRDEALRAAVAAIRAGQCIVLPTDTVYGIGANALDAAAVQALLDAKHRGRDMPPPVLIADAASLGALVMTVDANAQALADAHWPGPLTLILHAQDGLRMDLGETRGTIAVRVPDHDFTRALLRRTGPLAVSSANVSGQPASTTIDEARAQLGNSVAVYLDAGPTPGNVPSSIVDFTQSMSGSLLRLGALSVETLQASVPGLTVPEPPREVEAAPAQEEAAPSADEPAAVPTAEAEPTTAPQELSPQD